MTSLNPSVFVQTMVATKFMPRLMPIIEKLIKEDMKCVLLALGYFVYKHFSDILRYYKKYHNKGKIGRTYTLSIYSNKQTCKSIGSKEIKAILYDIHQNKDAYNITHFTTIACASTRTRDDWFALSSADYDNHIYIPTQDTISISFKTDTMATPMRVFIKKTEEIVSENDDKKKTVDEKTTFVFDIYSLEGNIEQFTTHCNVEYEKFEYDKKNKYPLIESQSQDKEDDSTITTRFHSNKTFETVFIEENIMQEIKSGISDVLTEASYFKQMGLTRKFVALLHGPPGTGKSSIVKAVLNDCQTFDKVRHIKRVDMSIIKDKDDLYGMFIDTDTKIIYLEEVDRAKCIHINQDEPDSTNPFNIKELSKLSKDELLEKIETFGKASVSNSSTNQSNIKIEDILELFDGLPELDGYIILMTTNNIDKIEPRFRRRCREFYIGYQSEELFKKQLEFYYECPGYFKANDIKLPSDKWTGCEIEKRFLRNPTYLTIESAVEHIITVK